jgi:hypothetical protein
MKYLHTATLLLILIGLPTSGKAVEAAKYKETTYQFTLHGRLSIYNGTPSFRIWIIGTNRILGVPGGDTEPAEMPRQLEKIFTSPGTEIYADFVVTPLTKYKPGYMQDVRIESVDNLIIYKDGKFHRRLKTL